MKRKNFQSFCCFFFKKELRYTLYQVFSLFLGVLFSATCLLLFRQRIFSQVNIKQTIANRYLFFTMNNLIEIMCISDFQSRYPYSLECPKMCIKKDKIPSILILKPGQYLKGTFMNYGILTVYRSAQDSNIMYTKFIYIIACNDLLSFNQKATEQPAASSHNRQQQKFT